MRPRTNRKGAVLLTVICFTTVCLMIATMALSAATVTMKRSNSNVRKTQAGITAQNYLDQFLKVFEKSDSSGNITYDDLKAVANGTNVNAPSKFNATIPGSSTNVGDCQVSVYQVSGGIVVESSCTYAGETEVASAFFKTKSEPFSSTNTIESNGNIAISGNAMSVDGNVMSDGSTTADVEYNNNSILEGDYYTTGNLETRTGSQVFKNGASGRALTVTTGGYIKFNNDPTIQYDPNTRTKDASGNYLNRNGYIYSGKKVIFSTEGAPVIGKDTDPVDIYCYGVIFGSVPQYVNKDGVNTEVKDYSAIDATVGAGGNNNSYNKMHGNIYCYTGSSTDYQDGSAIFNISSQTITLNGELYVDGNIYITGSQTTIIANAIHCKGGIFDRNGKKYDITKTLQQNRNDGFDSSITISASTIDNLFDKSKARNQMPDANYDPSKFDPSDLSDMGKYNPSRSSTSVYKDKYTANDMFIQNTMEAKNIQTLYKEAYSNTKIDTTYKNSAKISVPDGSGGWREETDDEYRARKIKENVQDWADYFYVDDACTQTLTSVLMDCKDYSDWNSYKKSLYSTLYVKDNVSIPTSSYIDWQGKTGFKLNICDKIWLDEVTTLYDDNQLKIVIKVEKDLAVLLPSSVNSDNGFKTDSIRVDFSNDAKDPTKNLPKHFVHFMMECGYSGSLYNVKYSVTNPVPDNLPTWNFNRFAIFDDKTPNTSAVSGSTAKANNIFYLIPDGVNINLSNTFLKGIIYGPQSDISINGGLSSNDDYAYYGQAFIRNITNHANGTKVAGLFPTEGSILEFINASNDSAVTLQYFAEVA